MLDKPQEIREGEQLDWDKLEVYLRENVEQLSGDFSVQQFHGGHANLTYQIKFGDQEYVLRRPPFGKLAPGTHSMKREYRVLSKLYEFYPEAPRAYHLCEDADIVGAEFVFMERKNGVIIRKNLPDCFRGMDRVHERLTIALVSALSDLHNINIEAAELQHLGKPEGFLERQFAGWSKRWAHSKTEENEAMDQTLKLLQEDIPTSQKVSVIHNDMKFDNCQFQADNPDLVTAVFDWDMCTLGDPLVDFGSMLSYWPDDAFKKLKGLPVILEDGFPDKDFVKKFYREKTKLNLDRIAWYESFSFMKTAVIVQQLYKRFYDGETKDPRMGAFGQTAISLSKLALSKLS